MANAFGSASSRPAMSLTSSAVTERIRSMRSKGASRGRPKISDLASRFIRAAEDSSPRTIDPDSWETISSSSDRLGASWASRSHLVTFVHRQLDDVLSVLGCESTVDAEGVGVRELY